MFQKKTHRRVICSLLAGFVLSGIFCRPKKYPDGLYAELDTDKGLIVLSLAYRETPMTVANFVGLAEGTIQNSAVSAGVPFYDGTKFHRVVEGHVIQAGIPDTEGEGQPGYMFPNEIHSQLSHDRAGILGMANGGPHTNSSQFYITLGDRSYLDGDYTVFGEVIDGMDIIHAIVQGDEIKSIKIVRIGRSAERFHTDTETFHGLVAQAQKRVEEEEKEKKARESALILKRWPDAIETDSGMQFVIGQEGTGGIPESGDKVRLRYTGEVLGEFVFFSTPEGTPDGESPAEEFVGEIGKSNVNPGFDQAISQMREGEKRIIILPSRLGYGTTGYYAKEIPGKKRFVISPNSTLVYDVELLEILARSPADHDIL